jgi:hypothetical protein
VDPATMTVLKSAQNTLGRLHDLETLISRVRAAQLDAECELLSELKALAYEADRECPRAARAVQEESGVA